MNQLIANVNNEILISSDVHLVIPVRSGAMGQASDGRTAVTVL